MPTPIEAKNTKSKHTTKRRGKEVSRLFAEKKVVFCEASVSACAVQDRFLKPILGVGPLLQPEFLMQQNV